MKPADFRQSDRPFQAVNQYMVKEPIGYGGMGTVYLAFDVQLKRHVALKVLKTLDQASLERFVREREITADLDHPNFVRILSMGYLASKDGLWPFYTMPLLRGETLATLLHRRSRAGDEGDKARAETTLPRLLTMVQQICLALESAHDRGIIHRDLKPSNIVLGPYGELYIVDLGLAKYLHEEEIDPPGMASATPDPDNPGSQDLTGMGGVGTPFYMAPEQVLKPSRVDARCDIFGVGAILYNILTGYRPIYAPNDLAKEDFEFPEPYEPVKDATPQGPARTADASSIPRWHQDEEPSTLASRLKFRNEVLVGTLVSPDLVAARRRRSTEFALEPVDPALSAICMKALARQPEDRYQTCRALWLELEQYLGGRTDLILKREAEELTRSVTRVTLPAAMRNYDLAERRLNERIQEKESKGGLGIEEKLDLFDLLIHKARIAERHGDSQSLIRAVSRVEPVLVATLEVLQRQHIQLLIAQGAALSLQEDPASSRSILSKAIALARIQKQDDLMASACCAYGVACSGVEDSAVFQEGLTALEDSITLADRSNDVAQAVRSRVGLARLHLKARVNLEKPMAILDTAFGKARHDPGLLAEVQLALGESHMARSETSLALRHLEDALKNAKEIDAQNLEREIHFQLGRALFATDPAATAYLEHFKHALRVRGPRRAIMDRRIGAFCDAHQLNALQLGLGGARETTHRSSRPAPEAGKQFISQ